MSTTPRRLVSRDEELAAIASLVASPDRRSHVAVLAGDAGIGKTTLMLAALESARERGARVLSARPSELEAGLSYVGLGDLFDDVAEEVDRPVVAPLTPRRLAGLVAARVGSGAPARLVWKAGSLAVSGRAVRSGVALVERAGRRR